MIPSGVEIYLALEPIDLRWGFDRLSDAVAEHMGRHARSGALFVFFGRRREALKILFADRTGICVFYKRLDRGRYRLPEAQGTARTVTMSEGELDDLLAGLDLELRERKTFTRH